MRKYYILDTNVLLHDPSSILSFQDNHVIVPIYVIEEVDHFKRQQSELGHNARRVSRLLDSFRRRGNLSEGVPTDTGGTLRVAIDGEVPLTRVGGDSNLVDNSLLSLALELAKQHADTPVVLVTKDTNLRIKADALGICAEDYETGRVDPSELYEGHTDIELEGTQLERVARGERIPAPVSDVQPNEYVRLLAKDGSRRSVLGRVDGDARCIGPLLPEIDELDSVRPRNMEQYFALDALLDASISLVTLMGKAGTGKTMLALAAGLHMTCRRNAYARLLVARPVFPLGRDVGYLPGGLQEKLSPWMQPIYDNLNLLFERPGTPHAKSVQSLQQLIETGSLAVEPLTYIRGRSMPRQYLIVDEVQNLTPLEVKTIVTRAGEETKLVLTGDPAQIDNPYIDSASNGFNTVVQRFRSEPMAAHVHLFKGERSALAERASNLL
ncbi:MAG: PhoH family protein [Candidatus Krumholzibacteriia bacterium]